MKAIIGSVLVRVVVSSAFAAAPATQPSKDVPWGEEVNGLRVALQVDSTTWPLHTPDNKPFLIRLKLHVQNVSGQPMRISDWRAQPGAILLANAAGKLVEWGGGSNVTIGTDKGKGVGAEARASRFVDLQPRQTHVFENTVQFDNGRLIWPILGGGIYHWLFKANHSLAPGDYQLKAIFESGSPSWHREAVSSVKITVSDFPAKQPRQPKDSPEPGDPPQVVLFKGLPEEFFMVADAIFPQVTFVEKLRRYIMVFNITVYREFGLGVKPSQSGIYIACSQDGIHWSKPTQLIVIQSIASIGKEIGWHPTLLLSAMEGGSAKGWLYYSYSESWGHKAPQKPHCLVGHPITFSIVEE